MTSPVEYTEDETGCVEPTVRVSESDAIALADLRTLDGWAMREGKPVQSGGYNSGFKVHLSGTGQSFFSSHPDNARHAAAEWVRSQ